jgi:glutathione peroxidase
MKNIFKRIILLITVSAGLFLFSFILPPKGIYIIKPKNIDGGIIELSKYFRKKMVFVVVSGNETDAIQNELSSFCQKYKDSCQVIGVLSIEDGYTEASKDAVRSRFKSKCPSLLLTEGMYTRKAAAGQSELMQWFTHIEQNKHTGFDITGAGWKFFVDETGELYATMGPQSSLSAPVLQRIMSKPARQLPKVQAAPLQKKAN